MTELEEAKRLAFAYHQTFTSEHGKVVLDDLRDKCHVDDETIAYDANSAVDVSGTLVNEGQRQVFVHIQDWLRNYVELMKREDEDE